jgi:hypothetical protein
VAGIESARFKADPAVVLAGSVLFEIEFSVFGFAKAGHGRELFLDSLEKVKERLALMRKIQL